MALMSHMVIPCLSFEELSFGIPTSNGNEYQLSTSSLSFLECALCFALLCLAVITTMIVGVCVGEVILCEQSGEVTLLYHGPTASQVHTGAPYRPSSDE